MAAPSPFESTNLPTTDASSPGCLRRATGGVLIFDDEDASVHANATSIVLSVFEIIRQAHQTPSLVMASLN
ncbi:hypothetical protein [Bradyrhizobium sp. McL0616]|uniref:hypothetical protein n=1 Tax=Bradyrhizobium sp. McL0616 TaxID=3415674 RepID=UPI003CF033F4